MSLPGGNTQKLCKLIQLLDGNYTKTRIILYEYSLNLLQLKH